MTRLERERKRDTNLNPERKHLRFLPRGPGALRIDLRLQSNPWDIEQQVSPVEAVSAAAISPFLYFI